MAKITEYDCGSCGHEASGYDRKDLEAKGWVWHEIPFKKVFIMCDVCESVYGVRRAQIETKEGST